METANTKKAGRRATGCKSKAVGENIRKFRDQKGLTQDQLAEGICSVQMISKIERGKANPSVEKLVKIAECLQVPLHEIYRPDAEDEFPNAVKLELAEVYMLRGELEPAQEMLDQLAQRDDLIEVERQQWGLLQGKVFNRCGKPEKVVAVLKPLVERLEVQKQVEDTMLCALYNTLGTAYFKRQDYTNAYVSYKRGYQISLGFPAFDGLSAHVVYNLGLVCNKMEFLMEAEAHLQTARDYYARVSDMRSLADSYFALAYATKDAQYATEALVLYRGLDCITMAHRVRQYYAFAVESKRDYENALQELHSAALDLEEVGDNGMSLYTLASAVTVCLENNDLDAAERFLLLANECREKVIGDQDFFLGEYYKVRSLYHLQMKDYDQCIQDSETSSELYAKIGGHADSADALELSAQAFHRKGMHEVAFQVSSRALDFMRKAHRRNER